MAHWLFDLMPFEFASPFFLLGAALAAGVLAFFSKRRKPRWLYSDFRLLGKRRREIFPRAFVWTLVVILTLSLFGALAKPVVTEEVVAPIRSRDFVCVVDFSDSMGDSFRRFTGSPSRESKFNAGRDALFDFIGARTSDRFGCVLFSVQSYSMPLLPGPRHIIENRALKDGLEKGKETILGKVYNNDTRVGTGILAGTAILTKMSSADTKVLILVSDLETNALDVDIPTALKRAKDAGVSRVYILAVEAHEFDLDKVKAATVPGEDFIRMFDIKDRVAFGEAYREIEQLEASQVGEKAIEQKKSIGEYFLLSAFSSFVFLAFSSFLIWRKSF